MRCRYVKAGFNEDRRVHVDRLERFTGDTGGLAAAGQLPDGGGRGNLAGFDQGCGGGDDAAKVVAEPFPVRRGDAVAGLQVLGERIDGDQ